ncbi:hypothetical protein EG329_009366 [Mollisiaceae sp. DMI_Dod_QoI]|nr:hypothetical protein EG329_009366 [Helotiales sp. DMI_Dod_QoI]
MSTPAAKRRRIETASQTLSKPFRSPFKTPLKSPVKTSPSESNTATPVPLASKSSNSLLSNPARTPSLPAPSSIAATNRAPLARKTFSSPVATAALNADPDIAPLLRTQRELEKELRELKEEVDTAEQARKIEADSQKKDPDGEIDGELMELIGKWKSASRLAAEELFTKVSERVNRMGGPRAWKEMQKKQQEYQNSWDQEEQTNNNDDDDDEDDAEGKEVEKRDIYAEYSIDPETENEKSQRPKGLGDLGDLPGQEDEFTMVDRNQEALVVEALSIAKKDIDQLADVVTHLSKKIKPQRGRASRKWGEIQIALKSGKINKMRANIESAKSTLSMLQTIRNGATMRQMNGMMDMLAAQFSTSIGSDPRSMIEDDRSQSKVSTYSPVRPSDLHVQTKTTRTSIKAGIALLNIQSSTTTIGYPEEYGNSKEISKPARTSFVVNFLWGFRSFDTLVRDTTFDAFNWTEDRLNYGTLVLHRGLPYENLKFLLSQDSYFVTPEDYYTVILENMFALRYDNEDIEDCVDLLLTKYQEMRRDPETRGQWPYCTTFIQNMLHYWIFTREVEKSRRTEANISRYLASGSMLDDYEHYEHDAGGTPLDSIARLDDSMIEEWLELLRRNGINILEYLQYESDRHPDGVVDQGIFLCCRHITLNFQHGEDGITGVEVENVCSPQYVHFHPEYRCEARRAREKCITQLPDIIIDEAGRPQDIPGNWSGALNSNSDSFLIYRRPLMGLEYVDFRENNSYLWDKRNCKWIWTSWT